MFSLVLEFIIPTPFVRETGNFVALSNELGIFEGAISDKLLSVLVSTGSFWKADDPTASMPFELEVWIINDSSGSVRWKELLDDDLDTLRESRKDGRDLLVLLSDVTEFGVT